eukprot:UN24743
MMSYLYGDISTEACFEVCLGISLIFLECQYYNLKE